MKVSPALTKVEASKSRRGFNVYTLAIGVETDGNADLVPKPSDSEVKLTTLPEMDVYVRYAFKGNLAN